MTFRPPRFLCHPGQSFAPKTLFPLVPRLGADSVLLTQRSKIERLHRSHRKLHSLFHRFTFFHGMPRFYLTTPPKSVTYVLNLLCYLCSEPAPQGAVRTSVTLCR